MCVVFTTTLGKGWYHSDLQMKKLKLRVLQMCSGHKSYLGCLFNRQILGSTQMKTSAVDPGTWLFSQPSR